MKQHQMDKKFQDVLPRVFSEGIEIFITKKEDVSYNEWFWVSPRDLAINQEQTKIIVYWESEDDIYGEYKLTDCNKTWRLVKEEENMVDKKFRKALNAFAEESEVEIKVLENHAYDKSVIGITEDNRLIYDYDKMIKEFAQDEGCDETEAQEWVDYNTVRALPYMGEDAPIIMSISKKRLMEYYGDED